MNTQAPVNTIKATISELSDIFNTYLGEKLALKPAPGKWSAKEILGHLTDSAINNLRRFTESTFKEKPYVVHEYDQDALVAANDYQHVPVSDILNLWKALNTQIIHVISVQTDDTLNYKVIAGSGEEVTLIWLMEDYVRHMVHHSEQIKKIAMDLNAKDH